MKQQGIKKLYYSISEVSKITDLEQYVLRYWETEFEQLKPAKNRAGNRIYTNRDIKLILYIKKLLRDERYTIEGAKQVLQNYLPEEAGEQLDLLAEPPAAAAVTAGGEGVSQPVQVARPSSSVDHRLKNDMVEIKKFLEEMLVRFT